MAALPPLPPEKAQYLRSLAEDPTTLFSLDRLDDFVFHKSNYKGNASQNGVWTRGNTTEEAQLRLVFEHGVGMLGPYGSLEATLDKWLDESHFKNMKYVFTGKIPFEFTGVDADLAAMLAVQPRCLWEIVRKQQGDPSYDAQMEGATLAPRAKYLVNCSSSV